ncbi:hypothetical protein [Glycomyces tenuis]|uniref:hypothetical protein n=1 Tax=Glycomyces tenuis TaxID=58116 RepID=UPI00047B873D|nr:hypothetical protein [Glycomyces tenuis]
MDERTSTLLGEPQRFWAAAEGAAAPSRRPAPDLSDLAEFTARVELRSPRWQGPALLAGLAVFCAVYAAIPAGTGLLTLSPQDRRIALAVLAAAFAAAAVAVLVWDLRTRAGAYRRAHAVFLERGIVAQGYTTSLDVGHEEYRPAWVLIDSRAPDERAARLYSAFDAWIDAVLADRRLRRRVVTWLRTGSGIIPSESLFGADAAGGHLVGPMSRGHWKLLLPSAGGRWKAHSILFADPSGEPPPTIGSGD